MENLVQIIKNEFEKGNNHFFAGFRGLTEDEEIIEKLTQWKNAIAYYGETDDVVFLIGDSEGEYGTRDDNEVRIIDPIVVAFV